MNEHDVRVRGDLLERAGDGVSAPRSTSHESHRLDRLSQIPWRVADELRRQRDNDFINAWMVHERRHAALENGTATNDEQLLETAAAKTLTAPGGRNDG
jgi:hypothetical protein